MAWRDANGTLRTNIILPSVKQPVPGVNPTDGLIDCLLPAPANPNGPWQSSYTWTIPSDWVSGVYLAKLTTGTNVTPQTTGRHSYIIFVVREDARPSDHLFQASFTTYQAYNYWGGRSTYDIVGFTRATNVSFNRPFGLVLLSECDTPYWTNGLGAGEFLTAGCAYPSWEYNMVRWLERQGYDVTYCSSIDTHRTGPASKPIKSFLSVGHDEYWSAPMRANVEAARDKGVNLAFFAANVCYWQVHFESGERVFAVDKSTDLGYNKDLWRGAGINC